MMLIPLHVELYVWQYVGEVCDGDLGDTPAWDTQPSHTHTHIYTHTHQHSQQLLSQTPSHATTTTATR